MNVHKVNSPSDGLAEVPNMLFVKVHFENRHRVLRMMYAMIICYVKGLSV